MKGMVMESTAEAGSATEHILRSALGQLKDRERKLVAFEREASEVRAGVKLLEKALGTKRSKGAAVENAQESLSPRARFTTKVVDLVGASVTPMSGEHIAKALDWEEDAYMASVLSKAVTSGALVYRDGLYHTASA